MAEGVTITPLAGLPEVVAGDDLAALLADAILRSGAAPRPGDVLVAAQKIISKAEGRFVDLATVTPSVQAWELGETTQKDPRLVELILQESAEVLRAVPGILIVRHRLGLVLANAGIDRSNVPGGPDGERVLLLPLDPDASAERLRAGVRERLGTDLGVIVSDSLGRAWRMGVVNVAIGAAGVTALWDRRGETDREGRMLKVTEVGHADALAAAAALVMGEAAEGCPAALVRTPAPPAPLGTARALVRPIDRDLFR